MEPSQEWFAVFVRLENDTKQAQAASTSYVISDTENHRYTPVAIGKANPFRYTAGKLGPGAVLPDPNSIPAQTSIGGEELLFKVDRTSMDNKPLILKITSPVDGADAARVNLDV